MARKHKLHCKLTGAGGGGCAWILLPPNTPAEVAPALQAELEAANMTVYKTVMGGAGLTLCSR